MAINKDNVLDASWNNESLLQIRTALQELLNALGDSIDAAADGNPASINLSVEGTVLTATVTLADGETELSSSVDLAGAISAAQVAVEIINNLYTNNSSKALSAAMGVQLDRMSGTVLKHLHWVPGAAHASLGVGDHARYFEPEQGKIYHFYGYTPSGQGQPELGLDVYTPPAGIIFYDIETGSCYRFDGMDMVDILSSKANANAVVKSISVNGGQAQTPNNGNVNIEVQAGGLTKEDISVETQGDGTVDINVGSGANKDTYTINLNHTHQNMAKLEIVDEEPSNPALDTIYALVNDAEDPTEIQSLWIAGLEFVGGGAAPGTPAITSPSGSTLNLGMNDGAGVEMDVVVKGRHLTGNLTMSVANNSGLSLSYDQSTGQSSVTIPKAVAETAAGATVKVVYSGSGALELSDAVTISGGGAETKYLKAVVVDRYAGFVFDKALARGELTDFQGKCVTPTFDLGGAGHFLTINFGYGTGTYGAAGYTSEDAFVDTWTASKVIRSVKLDDTVTKIRVTLDSTNLANCFIYDETDDVMLFKGSNVAFDDPYPGVVFGKKIVNNTNGQTGNDSAWCLSPILELSATGHTVSINFGFTSGVTQATSGLACYTADGSFVELFVTSAAQRTIDLSSYPTIKKLMLPAYLSGLEGCYVHDDTTDEYLWKGLNVQ